MGDSETPADPAQIERNLPRAVFAELVAGALCKASRQPSAMATAYLIELLDERIAISDDPDAEQTLAEALFAAQLESGPSRIRRLRSLGDRALFVSGFFGDSLARSVVDLDYYRQIGSRAYGELAVDLRYGGGGGSWTGLYTELARHFAEFVDVLAEVGDRSRGSRPANLLRLYDRYLSTGSPRDRERLIRCGQLPPDRTGLKEWQ
jgi:hypothetical protein